MRKHLLILALIICSFVTKAQLTAITEKGDTILIYENGTWETINKIEAISNIESNVKTTVNVDEFDNKKTIETERWMKFGVNEFNKYIHGNMYDVDGISLITLSYYGDLGCMSQYRSSIKIKLSNGEVIECAQFSDTDCDDSYTVNFIPATKDEIESGEWKSIVKSNIEMLKNYDWEMIRLNGTKYYTDLKSNVTKDIEKPEQFFRQHIIAIQKN